MKIGIKERLVEIYDTITVGQELTYQLLCIKDSPELNLVRVKLKEAETWLGEEMKKEPLRKL